MGPIINKTGVTHLILAANYMKMALESTIFVGHMEKLPRVLRSIDQQKLMTTQLVELNCPIHIEMYEPRLFEWPWRVIKTIPEENTIKFNKFKLEKSVFQLIRALSVGYGDISAYYNNWPMVEGKIFTEMAADAIEATARSIYSDHEG